MIDLKFKTPIQVEDVRWCVEAYGFLIPFDNVEYSGSAFAKRIRENFDCKTNVRNFAAAMIAEDGVHNIKRNVGDVITWHLNPWVDCKARRQS